MSRKPPKQSPSPPLCLLITGMHRSGTSLLAGLLSRAGVWLGATDELIDSNEENPTGFFERRDVRRLNDDVLFAAGCDWTEIDGFDAHALPPELHAEFQERARAILDHLGAGATHGVIGLKEPRLCPLLPLWLDCLSGPVAQILVHRPASEVALSLERRNAMPAPVAHHLHLSYLRHALAGAGGRPVLLTSYERCRTDPLGAMNDLRDALAELGADLPEADARALGALARDDLYRSRSDEEDNDVPRPLQTLLAGLAAGRVPRRIAAPPKPSASVLAWQHERRFTLWRAAHERALRLRGRLDRVEDERLDLLGKADELQRLAEVHEEEMKRRTSAEEALEQVTSERERLAEKAATETRERERLAEMAAAETRERERLGEALAQESRQRARLEKALETARATAEAMQSNLQSAEESLASERAQVATLQQQRDADREALVSLEGRLEESTALAERLESSLGKARRVERQLREELEHQAAAQREEQADFRRQLDLARERHEELQQAVARGELRSRRLDDLVKELRKMHLDAQASLFEVKQERDRKELRIGRLQRRLRDVRQAKSNLETDHQAVLNSLSWRVTAPARGALGLLPRGWIGSGKARRARTQRPVRAREGEPLPVLPGSALVITWDIGHNALGRSYMLAEVLEKVFRNVVIVGFRFERHGSETWAPLRDSRIPVIGLAGRNFPEFIEDLERIAERIRPDLVVACKARLPSLELGALIRRHCGCPLVLDIDDHELAFVQQSTPITLETLEREERGALVEEREPYSPFWTRCAEDARRYADAVLVSNPALQERFGGVLVPHVRDEARFDPGKTDRAANRAALGIPGDARVVLFFGTPRRHKGLEPLARAVAALPDDNSLLVVVGEAPDRRDTNELVALAGERLLLVDNQPFERIPDILSVADAVCLPQDPEHPISHYQLPAKAVDAIAMNIPLLVSDTPPLRWLEQLGLARVVAPDNLAETLARCLDGDHDMLPDEERRQRFLDELSYGSAAAQLHHLCAGLLEPPRAPGKAAKQFERFLRAQRKGLGLPVHPPKPAAPKGATVVLFWKQNDTTLYGRRVDMVVRVLAERPEVARVLVFDAPISEYDLTRLRQRQAGPSQGRWIYRKAYEKLLGEADHGKVSYHVFAHPAGVYDLPNRETPGRRPLAEGFVPFVESELLREGIEPTDAVFWFYPRFFLADALIDSLKPRRVVVDVVDDHREWPGLPDQEIELLTAHYRSLLSRADLSLVNCEPMREKMAPLARNPLVCVPNGCDAHAPARTPSTDDQAFEALRQGKGPVIGYVGNLEAKIDVALIEHVAQSLPEARILLLGSAHATNAALRLQELDNVVMPGVVPYDQVGAWLQRMNVAMVPHLHTSMTENMNPLKVFVYLQWGVPVVSTDIPNIGYEGPLLRVAPDPDAFVDALRTFIESPPDDIAAERDAFVRENSWETRFTPLLDEFFAPLMEELDARAGAGAPGAAVPIRGDFGSGA